MKARPAHICECNPGPAAGTAIASSGNGAPKLLTYANIGGVAIFEGDINLGTVDEMIDIGAEGIAVTGPDVRWPEMTIPYEIASSLTNKERVTAAITHWEDLTDIRFVARTAGNANAFPDFVVFQPSIDGCSSAVGRRGGRQAINIGPQCSVGNVIHEIGHTVGLWHEQSREDRDQFIEIRFANILPETLHNFDQHIQDGADLGVYDFGSIMHYPRTAFTANGHETIVPRHPLADGVVIGQRTALSVGDIAAVAAMYELTLPSQSHDAPSPAVADSKTLS